MKGFRREFTRPPHLSIPTVPQPQAVVPLATIKCRALLTGASGHGLGPLSGLTYDSELAGFEAFSLGCAVDPRSGLGLGGKHFDADRLLLDLGFVVETHNPHCSPVAVRHFFDQGMQLRTIGGGKSPFLKHEGGPSLAHRLCPNRVHSTMALKFKLRHYR